MWIKEGQQKQTTQNTNQMPKTIEEAQEEDNEENKNMEGGQQWTTVTYRTGRQQETETGTRSRNELQAAEKRAWLYVGRLRPGTTGETIKKFLEKKGIKDNVSCEELTTNNDIK